MPPAPGHKEAERARADLQGGGLQLRGDSAGRLHVLSHELSGTRLSPKPAPCSFQLPQCEGHHPHSQSPLAELRAVT